MHGHRAHEAAVRLPPGVGGIKSVGGITSVKLKRWKKVKRRKIRPRRHASAAEALGICQSALDRAGGPQALMVAPTSVLQRHPDDCRWPMEEQHSTATKLLPCDSPKVCGMNFEDMDLNRDGVISREEFDTAAAAHQIQSLMQPTDRRARLQPSLRGSTFTPEALRRASVDLNKATHLPTEDKTRPLQANPEQTKKSAASLATQRASPGRRWRGGSNWMRNVMDAHCALRI